MRLLEKYITLSVIKIFILTILTFCFLFIIGDAAGSLDEMIEKKVPIAVLAQYYLSFIPIVYVQSAAVACLISALVVYAGLNQNNEIIAMRASGLNFWRIAKPILIFSIFVSVSIFWAREQFLPEATVVNKQLEREYIKTSKKKKSKNIENITFYGLNNRLFFVEKFNADETKLNGIIIIEYDNDLNVREKIVALEGEWIDEEWIFHQTHVTEYDPLKPNVPLRVKTYPKKIVNINETPDDFYNQQIDVNSMNIKQLSQYIDRFKNSGASKALNSLRVDFHQKIAFPLGCFVILLVGLPFAMKVESRKRSTFTSLALAIGIGFLFYLFNAIAVAFGKGGTLPPFLAAWITPIIFIGAGIVAIQSDFSN